MITVNEGLDAFLNNYIEAPIYIYGAGHCGDWIGEFMNRCNIEFTGYIDKRSLDGEMLNKKPCYRPEVLKNYKDVRIILSPSAYKSIRYDLLEVEHKYGVNCICIIPASPNARTPESTDGYDINKFLGYFRKRFLKNDLPMIISNDTTSGDLLRMFAGSMDEYVPYVGFTTEDFLKVCDNPERILKHKPVNFFPTSSPRLNQGKHLCGVIDDITIHFFKCMSEEKAMNGWERYRENYSSKRFLFILSDHNGCITKGDQEHFDSIPHKRLTLRRRDRVFFLNDSRGSELCMDWYFLTKKDFVIENGFDLIGWINNL